MKNSLLAGSGAIRSRGCFFVGRVAESQLIGAGKQRGHPVATGGAFILWRLAALSSQLSIIHGIKMKSPLIKLPREGVHLKSA